MRGRKAKAVRKAVYGDNSLRQKREYFRINNSRHIRTGDLGPGTVVNTSTSLRSIYQRTKRGTL
jgi:hypothetical protein